MVLISDTDQCSVRILPDFGYCPASVDLAENENLQKEKPWSFFHSDLWIANVCCVHRHGAGAEADGMMSIWTPSQPPSFIRTPSIPYEYDEAELGTQIVFIQGKNVFHKKYVK